METGLLVIASVSQLFISHITADISTSYLLPRADNQEQKS